MPDHDHRFHRPELEQAPREHIEGHQLERLKHLADLAFEESAFYQAKWSAAGLTGGGDIEALEDLRALPFTTRAELAADQEANPPYGSNLTQPREDLAFWHRTSGRKGNPLIVVSTRPDWDWMGETWCYNFASEGLDPGDTLFIAFSFGPYAGLWGAVAGAERYSLMMIPGGGQRTLDRLHFILDLKPAAIACIPTYALRMVETAAEHGLDMRAAGVRALILGGEPGASVPATRARIEAAWGGKAFDTTGQSEVGHHGFECLEQSGVHIIESEFIIEVINPETAEPVPSGQVGEMVVTSLGKLGMPVVRYRSGDLVRLSDEPCGCGRTFARLEGGILSRQDEMVTVRGINVFPTAIEDCLMNIAEIAEYRADIYEVRGMRELKIRVEPSESVEAEGRAPELGQRVSDELRRRLTLRADIEVVPAGSLPRPPGKAYRFTRHDQD